MRKDVKSYHFDVWHKQQPYPYITTHTREPPAKIWIEKNQPLFESLNYLFAAEFSEIYKMYLALELPCRFFGTWATITLNVNFASLFHKENMIADMVCVG